MEFLKQYWPFLVFILFMVGSVVNTLTPHFSKESGVKKGLLIASEMIALFTSKEVSDRLFKLPATSVAPKEKK